MWIIGIVGAVRTNALSVSMAHVSLRILGRVTGWTCIAIGGIQLVGGAPRNPA